MRLVALACALLSLAAAAAPAPPGVDVALVLLTDVSRSIDDSEFDLEKSGYVDAITNPRVIAAIQGGPAGRIAVAYVEFAGASEVQTVLDWTTVSDAATAHRFAADLAAAPRSFHGRTAIGAGIERATQMLATNGLGATRSVIDVAGDGTNNAGPDSAAARDAAVEAGITINGLTIINDHPAAYIYAHTQPPGGLAEYYRENVTGGPGSFVIEVHDFHTFGQAMLRKLLSEIAANPHTRT